MYRPHRDQLSTSDPPEGVPPCPPAHNGGHGDPEVDLSETRDEENGDHQRAAEIVAKDSPSIMLPRGHVGTRSRAYGCGHRGGGSGFYERCLEGGPNFSDLGHAEEEARIGFDRC